MVKRNLRVLVVADDPFASGWETMLLARDWRTNAMGEVHSLLEASSFLSREGKNINMALVDTDLLLRDPANTPWWQTLPVLSGKPAVLLVGHRLDPQILQHLPFENFCGYLLKKEIRDSLSWAVSSADRSCWAVTPGVLPALQKQAPGQSMICLDGDQKAYRLRSQENEAFARLAFTFSMERGELKDETSLEWVYGKISEIYDDLDLDNLLSGASDPVVSVGESLSQHPHFVEVIQRNRRLPKGKQNKGDKEELAFYLITMPKIERIR